MASNNDSLLIAVGAAISLNEARPHMVKLAMIHKLVAKGDAKFEGELAFLARICKAAAEFADAVMAEKEGLTGAKTATAEDALELIKKAGQS